MEKTIERDRNREEPKACVLLTEERCADMVEAMMCLTFLMRVDIGDRENLHKYLTYMDSVLESLIPKPGPSRSN